MKNPKKLANARHTKIGKTDKDYLQPNTANSTY